MTGEPANGAAGPGIGQPRLEVVHEGAICVVRVSGEHDLSTAEDLQRTLGDCLARGDRVVVDLRQATFVDFRIIGVLALCHRQAATRPGRAFALVAGEGSLVGRVLRLTGLDSVVPVYATVAEASSAIG